MQFSSIPGHAEIKARLINTVQANRISHAQLFLAPPGAGGFPLALAYAQYINCLNPQPTDSCGECDSCRKYLKLVHPDLHFSYPFFPTGAEDTAAAHIKAWRQMVQGHLFFNMDTWRSYNDVKKQPNINIAECHAIIKKLSLKAFEAKTKVLIMWLPEYLGKEGNTLLKLIEEPPANTLFLLVAESTEHILNTILSRTQLIKIPAYPAADVADWLTQTQGTDGAQAQDIAFIADGNMAEAERLAQSFDTGHLTLLQQWLQNAYLDKGPALFTLADQLAAFNREEQKAFLQFAINFVRECTLLLGDSPQLVKLPPAALTIAQNLSSRVLTLPMAQALANTLSTAWYHADRNANAKILFLDVSLELIKILKYRMFPTEAPFNI